MTVRDDPGNPAGFVLVNALVLVAALAAVAVLLALRAETARGRGASQGQADQLILYADAFETHALNLLMLDTGAVDHPGEDWARADTGALALDRGAVAGRIEDLQARFNLNWLSDPSDVRARVGWDALTRRLGLSPTAADAVVAALSPEEGGGALLMPEQLVSVAGLDPGDLDRLRPHVTALPWDATINVNTVDGLVLASLLPGSNPAALDNLLVRRRTRPFDAIEDFMVALAGVAPPAALEDLPAERFSVGSSWFGITLTARLETLSLHRTAVIRRLSLPSRPFIVYRLDHWP